MIDFVKLVYEPWTKRAARRALVGRLRARHSPERGRFTRSDVDGVLVAVWRTYAKRAPLLTSQRTLGSTMNVRPIIAATAINFRSLFVATDARNSSSVHAHERAALVCGPHFVPPPIMPVPPVPPLCCIRVP